MRSSVKLYLNAKEGICMIYTIAVDGPVGAGKSSVADEVAKRLGILHLDTGAMYRAFAWKAVQEGVSLEDEQRNAMAYGSKIYITFEGKVMHFFDAETDTNLLV